MESTTVYRQAPDCLLEDMDGEMLLYQPRTAPTLHLNDSSAVIWNLCDGERSVGEIVDALREAFPEQASEIEADVSQVINELLKSAVLQPVE